MNTIIMAVGLLAAIISGSVWLANRLTRGKVAYRFDQWLDRGKDRRHACMANAYTTSPSSNLGTHKGTIAVWVQSAVSQRYLLYSLGVSNVATPLALGTTMPHGTIADETTSAEVDSSTGYYVGAGVSGAEKNLSVLGKSPTTQLMVPLTGYTPAMTDEAFATAGGYVVPRPTASGTYWKVGVVVGIDVDSKLVEVADCVAQRVTV